MKRILIPAALLLAVTVVPLSALACGGANSSSHVGRLAGIDSTAGTLTIVDGESGAPITFDAQRDIIDELLGHQGMVRVDYESSDGTLRATEVIR